MGSSPPATMAQEDADATAWLEWLVSGSYANARRLLRADQGVNVQGARGMTALHVVAEIGSLEKVQRLLMDGADPRLANIDSKTPLHFAQFEAHADVAYALLETEEMVRALERKLDRTPSQEEIHGMLTKKTARDFRQNVKTKLKKQTTMFLNAARRGDLATVQLLLLDGVPINAVDSSTCETAFSIALAGGRRRMYELLMDKGASPFGLCIIDGETISMLAVAVERGDVDLVQRLIACGARVSTPKIEQTTCVLSRAVEKGSTEMIQILVDSGARFDWCGLVSWQVQEVLKATPLVPWQLLYWACRQQNKQRVGQLIASYKRLQSRCWMARLGREALVFATYQGDEELVMELLARGARVSFRALYAAVSINAVGLLHILLKHHGDDSIVQESLEEEYQYGGSGKSLLSFAVGEGAVECAKALLPLETRAIPRHVALVCAISGGIVELVESLLRQVTRPEGMGFLDCVQAAQCPLVLDLLLTHCCPGQRLHYSLDVVFPYPSAVRRDKELLDVFIAHGIGVDIANILAVPSLV